MRHPILTCSGIATRSCDAFRAHVIAAGDSSSVPVPGGLGTSTGDPRPNSASEAVVSRGLDGARAYMCVYA